jgi:hypothetical protein
MEYLQPRRGMDSLFTPEWGLPSELGAAICGSQRWWGGSHSSRSADRECITT